jgi:hypothetical protein
VSAVLFVHGITAIGGAERELLVMLERLPQRGYRPIVACPDGGPLAQKLVRRGVETRVAPMPPWRKLFAYPKRPAAVRALRDVIAAVRPALIHVNDIWWVPQTLRAVGGVRILILAHVRQEIEPPKCGGMNSTRSIACFRCPARFSNRWKRAGSYLNGSKSSIAELI